MIQKGLYVFFLMVAWCTIGIYIGNIVMTDMMRDPKFSELPGWIQEFVTWFPHLYALTGTATGQMISKIKF